MLQKKQNFRISSGTNEENRVIKDKISVGKMLLLDWYDNYVYAILDACVLSSFRTAAISVLACSLAPNSKGTVHGILGLGRIGFYTAVVLHHWLGVNSINCYDANRKVTAYFTDLISMYAPDLQINLKEGDCVINDSASIFLTTDSKKPILNSSNGSHLNFISSVGADADNLSELHESIINGFQIITDSFQSMLLGDMKVWQEKKLISQEDVIELKDIVKEQHQIKSKTLFISTGVAVQDALIARFIVDNLSDEELY